MKKIELKQKQKKLKMFLIFVYIEVLTFLIINYMELLESVFKIDFRLNNTHFKLNSPLILFSNPPILILIIFITGIISVVIKNYNKSIENAKQETEGIKYKEKDGTHGTASFGNPHKMENVLMIGNEEKENGMILGKTIDTDEIIMLPDNYKELNRNCIIIGASGAGKSRKFITPNILKIAEQDERTMNLEEAIKYGKNVVVTDPKGELYSKNCKILEKYGYEVKLLNLVNPEYSDGVDMIKFMSNEIDAQTFAKIVNTTQEVKTKKGDEFWQITQENLMKALLLHVILEVEDENKKNMEYLYSIISSDDINKIDKVFENSKGVTRKAYNIYARAGDTIKQSVVTGLATKLQIFQLPRINTVTKRNDINFNELCEKKMAIFCVISDTDMTLSFLNSLFFSFLFINVIRYADKSKDKKLKRELSIILDEFPNIGEIPDFRQKQSTIRSRGISATIVCQNVAGLENLYPNNGWQSLIRKFRYKNSYGSK